MDKQGTIIAIARYIEDSECICKHCGSVSDIEDVNIFQQAINNGKPRWRVECPECDGFIRWAATEKIKRVWFKGEMHQIGDLETGLLMWMLSKGIGHAKYIYAVLKGRMGVENVPDIPMTINKPPGEDGEKKIQNQIDHNQSLVEKWQKEAVANFNSWDSTRMEDVEKKIKRYKTKNRNLEKKLASRNNPIDPNQMSIEQ